ncbi:MAG: UTP--glucose-1-phosphate uridylyltransferase [Verrucomicrobiota bacterium]
MSEANDRMRAKMRAAGVGEPTIDVFVKAVERVKAGERGLLAESAIEPVTSVPALEELTEAGADGSQFLRHLAVIKLNGGLGTSMGLDKAKSLLVVKDHETFLDFTARQIFHLRGGQKRGEPAFYLMNSFVTRDDTLQHLRKYPELGEEGWLDFVQNKVPKIDAESYEPVTWAREPDLEWCPPGHGDLYPSLLGSGLLERLLEKGIRYLFVSNSDNLGATVDLKILRYFVQSGASFLMEVAARTAADRKGGHLARDRQNGRLLLRELAQCPKGDEDSFQDVEKYRFFNTNNLWIRVDHLQEKLDLQGGSLPLPLITNLKTIDPREGDSPKVLQLESAMGAAIECFENSGAVVVPRSRFSPVKTTSDLLALRSDAYRVTEDWRLVLERSRKGQPPLVELDANCYKMLADFEACFPEGAPSLIACQSLKVEGPVRFARGVVCQGNVEFVNPSSTPKTVAAGIYRDRRISL